MLKKIVITGFIILSIAGLMANRFIIKSESRLPELDEVKDTSYIYKKNSYTNSQGKKETFYQLNNRRSTASSNQHQSKTVKSTLPLEPSAPAETATFKEKKHQSIPIQAVGPLNLHAQGTGNGLQVSISILNGKLQIDQCTSIPVSAVKRKKVHAASHLAVFTDAEKKEVLVQGIQFHKLRAPLPDPSAPKSLNIEADYDEYYAIMTFTKPATAPVYIDIYRFTPPFTPELTIHSINQFKQFKPKLTLTYRGLLK